MSHVLGDTLTDFEWEPKIFLIMRITHDFTDFPSEKFSTKLEHNNVDRCRHVNFRNKNFKNFTIKGCFPTETQKLLTKFTGLAISGRNNSAMITDCRKFTAKLTLYGMCSFHFYR